jgi:hypothetical protein
MIGVIASSRVRAQRVIDELQLRDACILTNNASSARGMKLDAVVVDETATPLRADVLASVNPAVENGRIYQLLRHIPEASDGRISAMRMLPNTRLSVGRLLIDIANQRIEREPSALQRFLVRLAFRLNPGVSRF